MERTVKVELTDDEVLAIIKLVTARLEYLVLQPRTPERDEETRVFWGYLEKTVPQVSAHAQAEKNEARAQQT